jgi:hypothetical protein
MTLKFLQLFNLLILLTNSAFGAKNNKNPAVTDAEKTETSHSTGKTSFLGKVPANLPWVRSYHTVPSLANFLIPFSSCLVHLINYQSLDLPFPSLPSPPLILERFRFHITPNKKNKKVLYGYTYDKANANTTNLLYGRRQPANFRWTCVLHLFLLPNTQSREYRAIPYEKYLNFWNPIKRKAQYWTQEVRFDYFFLLTDSLKVDVHRTWVKELELSLHTEGGGYFLSSIVELKEEKHLMLYEISRLSLVAPFASPKKFDFLSIPLPIHNLGELERHFASAFDLRDPLNPIEVTDMIYSGPLFQIKPLVLPTFFTFGQHESDSTDLAILSIASPRNTSFQRIFVPNVETLVEKGIPSAPWIIIRNHLSSYMSLYSAAFSFLTCDGLKSFPRPSFLLFVSAFNLTAWLAILVAALFLAFFLKLAFKVRGVSEEEGVGSPLLVPLTAFLEQGVSVGRDSVSLSILVGSWSLVCLILSNAYKGQNIVDLTAPLRPTVFDSFKDLVEFNFTIYSRKMQIYQLVKKEYIDYPRDNMTELMKGFFIFTDSISDDARRRLTDSNHVWNGDKYTELRELVEGVFNRTRALNKAENRTLLETVLECNRSALVDMTDKVDMYEVQLRKMRPREFIAKGKPSSFLFPVKGGWFTSPAKDPNLHGRLERILQGGIAGLWGDYKKFMSLLRKAGHGNVTEERITNEEMNGSTNGKPLSLGGNLKVVFYLFSFIMTMALCVFFVESCFSRFCLQ